MRGRHRPEVLITGIAQAAGGLMTGTPAENPHQPYLKDCREDTPIRVGLVRQFGWATVDADVTVPGTQALVPASTKSPRGRAPARSPGRRQRRA